MWFIKRKYNSRKIINTMVSWIFFHNLYLQIHLNTYNFRPAFHHAQAHSLKVFPYQYFHWLWITSNVISPHPQFVTIYLKLFSAPVKKWLYIKDYFYIEIAKTVLCLQPHNPISRQPYVFCDFVRHTVLRQSFIFKWHSIVLAILQFPFFT